MSDLIFRMTTKLIWSMTIRSYRVMGFWSIFQSWIKQLSMFLFIETLRLLDQKGVQSLIVKRASPIKHWGKVKSNREYLGQQQIRLVCHGVGIMEINHPTKRHHPF